MGSRAGDIEPPAEDHDGLSEPFGFLVAWEPGKNVGAAPPRLLRVATNPSRRSRSYPHHSALGTHHSALFYQDNLDLDVAIALTAFAGPVFIDGPSLAHAGDDHQFRGYAFSRQVVPDRIGVAIGQAVVIVLIGDVIGMSMDNDALDRGIISRNKLGCNGEDFGCLGVECAAV